MLHTRTKSNMNLGCSQIFPKNSTDAKNLSEDKLSVVSEALSEIYKHPYPKILFIDKKTTTNDTIAKLKSIVGLQREDTILSRIQEAIPSTRVRRDRLSRVTKIQQRLKTSAKEPTRETHVVLMYVQINKIGTDVKKYYILGIFKMYCYNN